MEPSRVDRLDLLFEGDHRPPLPDPSKPHIAEQDLAASLKSMLIQTQVPTTASCPRDLTGPALLPENNDKNDQIHSSEEDEYLAHFVEKSKPKLNPKLGQSKSSNQKNAKSSASRKSKFQNCRKAGLEAYSGNTSKHESAYSRSTTTPSTYSEEGFLIGSFCPLLAVSRFPYKYIGEDAGDRVAKLFFDQGKFWSRAWQIYYIHPPALVSHKPLLLVPDIQVQELVDEINAKFRCALEIPADPELGFLISFYDNGSPQPQFLGVSLSKTDCLEMESTISSPAEGYGETPAGGSTALEISFAAFKLKMERAVQATQRKTKALKKKKNHSRLLQQQDWIRSLKRAQRYVGLRPRVARGVQPILDGNLNWEEQKAAQLELDLMTGVVLFSIKAQEPVPYPFDSDVIFISVDVESYERDHRQITEIGVSTLDTRDIVGVAPGEEGKTWRTYIRSRHFRVKEFATLVNSDFVKGSPDKFMFGHSEWVSLRDAPSAVDSCFQGPFSSVFRHDGSPPATTETGQNGLSLNAEVEGHPMSHREVEQKLINTTPGLSNISPHLREKAEENRNPSLQSQRANRHDSPSSAWNENARSPTHSSDESFSSKDTMSKKEPVDTKGPTTKAQAIANEPAVETVVSELGIKSSTVHSMDNHAEKSAIFPYKNPELGTIEAEQLCRTETAGDGKATRPTKRDLEATGYMQPKNRADPVTIVGGRNTVLGNGEQPSQPVDIPQEFRKIVLVGHDTQTDISYLRRFGCKTMDKDGSISPTLLEALDTAILYKVFKREMQTRSLGNLLVEFAIEGWHLHNAGNDARYTLELMLAMLFRSRLQGSPNTSALELDTGAEVGTSKAWKDEVERRVEVSTKEAEMRIREECDSWAIAAGEVALPQITKIEIQEDPISDLSYGKMSNANKEQQMTASDLLATLDGSIDFNDDDVDGGEALGIGFDLKARIKSQEGRNRAQLDEWRKDGLIFAAVGEGLEPDPLPQSQK